MRVDRLYSATTLETATQDDVFRPRTQSVQVVTGYVRTASVLSQPAMITIQIPTWKERWAHRLGNSVYNGLLIIVTMLYSLSLYIIETWREKDVLTRQL